MRKIIAISLLSLSLNSFALDAASITPSSTIDLSGLYDKFKGSSKDVDDKILAWKEFDAAMKKGTPPTKLLDIAKHNSEACNYMGVLLATGKGMKQDYLKAEKWFLYCTKNNAYSAYNIGILYNDGNESIKQDKAKSIPYIKKAWNETHEPKAGIRLAYWYRSQKSWKEEWDTLALLEASHVYQKHWGFLQGEMIVYKRAPIYDINKANVGLSYAANSYHAEAAELFAYSLGSGLGTGTPDLIHACQYDIIANEFSGGKFGMRWQTGLSDIDLNDCQGMAKKFISDHPKPAPIDFKAFLF